MIWQFEGGFSLRSLFRLQIKLEEKVLYNMFEKTSHFSESDMTNFVSMWGMVLISWFKNLFDAFHKFDSLSRMFDK